MTNGPEMPAWVAALRPGEIPLWATFAGSFALVLILYAAKFLALRRHGSRAAALALFLSATAVAVPVTYLLASDWGNPIVAPAAVYVGNPVATLGVPCASFEWDWATREPEKTPRAPAWRAPFELLVGVPLWWICWIYFEILVLNWISI